MTGLSGSRQGLVSRERGAGLHRQPRQGKFHQEPEDSPKVTLPETASLHLKMDSWNTILSFWHGLFSGVFVGFRKCNSTF